MLVVTGMVCAQAQGEHTIIYPGAYYMSGDIGMSLYTRNHETSFGLPALGVAAGWWISSPLAFQVAADGLLTRNSSNNQSFFLFATAEFKWNANYTFFHVYNERFLKPIPFYPLMGLGLLWTYDMVGDEDASVGRSFTAMLGIEAPVKITDRLSAKLDYQCFFLPQGFDNSYGDNFLHMVRLGLTYSGVADAYHHRPEYEAKSFGDDWFFGIGVGPNYSAFDLFTNPNSGGTDMLGVAPEIMVGHNFSSFWAVRFELTGLTAHEAYDTILQAPASDYRFTLLHTDIMINLNHMIDFKRGYKWNFMPYLGAGLIWRYDNPKLDMAVDGGLFVRRYINYHSDLFADLKYIMMSPAMGGGPGPSQSPFGVGIPSLTVGYMYNFGHSSTRYRLLYNCAD